MNKPSKSEKEFSDATKGMSENERTVFLERTPASDSELRRRAEELLAQEERRRRRGPDSTAGTPSSVGPSGTIVTDEEATLGTAGAAMPTGPEEAPGDFIGRYKLLEKIGEGGFGMVYVAEQTDPVTRQVALKIIKLGMDTRQVVGRFEAERQALALMDHPNIAKVLDAGATDTGRPYFVMELVRGTKITDYCDNEKLSTRKRLDLFILVCRAVEHAHQKGIIHRDIKPSNILVTTQDGVAVPKVIDFGIAKATQKSMADNAAFTQFDQFVGTPAYMSPEQAEVGGLDVDTRSDIYSLGVLLYELLTGETPLESKNLLSRGFDEMRKIIREWEPQRPSIRLHKQEAGDQTTVAARHGTDSPKLIRMVRGDLDWVVMKCLEKDRSRRYDTAAELTTEIQRFLANEPVMARPPSKWYRFGKLVRRNRLAFAAGSAILTCLIVGLCVTSWFVVKEKKERELAESSSEVAEKGLKIAVAERAKAERALAQATEARNKSNVDQQLRRQASAKADTAEQAAADFKKEAEAAQLKAETALQQAKDDREKAGKAEKAAQDSSAQAQSALQLAKAAETRADTEAARREEAVKAAASETTLRQQAESALTEANAARQQAENLNTVAQVQSAQLQATILNLLAGLESLPPAEALKAVNNYFSPGDERQPWAARFLRQRGEWHARTAGWTAAAADFSQAVNLQAAEAGPYDALALLHAQSGDSNAVGHDCAQLVKQFGTNDPAVARLWVRDCLLTPIAGLDLGAVTATARRAVDAGTNNENQLAMGLAEYRQGHYTNAADWLNKALAGSGTNAVNEVEGSAVLAMTLQQLKQTEAARAALVRGTQAAETKLPAAASGDLGPNWGPWIIAHVLLREAAALIPPPAPPPATK